MTPTVFVVLGAALLATAILVLIGGSERKSKGHASDPSRDPEGSIARRHQPVENGQARTPRT